MHRSGFFARDRQRLKFASKAAPALIAALAISACASLSELDPFAGDAADFAAGAPDEIALSGRDRDALAYAFTQAMTTGKPQGWSGARARGVVEPLEYALANLKGDPDARIEAARGDFELNHVVETDLGLYVLTRNSNVRLGPGTHARSVEVLPSGAGVDVVGRVTDRNWMLVAADGAVRGYVFGDLLVKAPGTELELAGGPIRKPLLCRNFRQRINIYSERAEWEGAACNDGTGWRLAPPDAYAPRDLLEY